MIIYNRQPLLPCSSILFFKDKDMAAVIELSPACDHLSPDKVVDLLRKHGTIVTIEEARLIQPFLQNLANIAVAQALREQPANAIAA